MFCIRIAELVIEIDNRYGYVEELCRDYIVHDGKPLFRVSVSRDELDTYISASGRCIPLDEAESHLIYRRICGRLPMYGAFVFHAAAVLQGERAYAFSAARGVGKTTHAKLWQEVFNGNGLVPRAEIINGDKPILRAIEGRLWIWGTPWSGKERIQKNTAKPLCAICFLEQGRENIIEPCRAADTIARILESTEYPDTQEGVDALARLVAKTVKSVPSFTLKCRPDEEAVRVAWLELSHAEEGLFEI